VEISVVIPTKDRVKFLERVLPTYLMQSEVKEVVVVIDGSTDGTREFLDRYCKDHPSVRYLDNGRNRGTPYTKNRGVEAARCDYIFIGEDDLELTDGFFATLGPHLLGTDADLICGRNIFRHEQESGEEAIARTDKLVGPYVNLRRIETETSMDVGTDKEELILAAPVLGRAEVFREIKFDEMYEVNFWREETDFQLSAREKGYKLYCCPHAICFNFLIENDRGGAHATIGLRRLRWTIINNWRFLKKHDQFIGDHFNIGNKYLYITKFAIRWLYVGVIWPPTFARMSRVKRRTQDLLFRPAGQAR
jgi:glycosyltransferase involved in cell wall biosynthesis